MSISQLDMDLNNMIREGKLKDAFEKFYAENVTMQENTDAPCVGKAANRSREAEMLGNVVKVHRLEFLGSAVSGDRSFSEWVFDLEMKGGARMVFNQVAARTWKNNQVVTERFYYKP